MTLTLGMRNGTVLQTMQGQDLPDIFKEVMKIRNMNSQEGEDGGITHPTVHTSGSLTMSVMIGCHIITVAGYIHLTTDMSGIPMTHGDHILTTTADGNGTIFGDGIGSPVTDGPPHGYRGDTVEITTVGLL